jgi:hypothetical protein
MHIPDIKLRAWELNDACDLVSAINNKKVLDNLRDGDRKSVV